MNIEILKVQPNRVDIQAGNVRFVFVKTAKGTKRVSKGKPEAQVHDPAACWVPKDIFNRVCRTAAAILSDKKKRKEKELILFPT